MLKPEFIARQGSRPTGCLGRIVARVMARETMMENRFALNLLALEDGDSLLDIGCGHGETLFHADAAAKLSSCVGIDFSDVMLRRAKARNRGAVRNRRMEFLRADSRSLPLADNLFSKSLSVHTVYFWPDPIKHLAEIRRVLKPGGSFVLCFRSTQDKRALATCPSTIYRFRSVHEIETLLAEAGFSTIESHAEDIGNRLIHWTRSVKQ